MSADAGSSSDLSERVDDIADWYHIPLLVGAMAFMFATRYRSADNFVHDDGWYVAAIDSYYHWRTTVWTVENWPNTMPYDVWTSWPDGRYVGQFGTAYDQIVATIALIVGLGNPSEAIIHQTILITIPLMAALVAIPIYFIGKRLGGRLAGIGGVFLLALFPGQFYSRSMAGQHQHHVAEVLFMAITILAFMYALRVAEREKPVYEQFLDRDFKGLQPTILASGLAGATLAFYQWMWPPGVVLVGILAVFFVIYLSFEFVIGRSPEHTAFVAAISMFVAGVLVLGMIEEISTSPTSFGYISPVLSFGVVAGSIFMAWLARFWDREQITRWAYAGTVIASVIVFLGILWLVLPDVFDRMVGDLQGRILPIGSDPGTLTIQEARPPADYTAQVFQEFGLAFYTALIGLAGLVVAPFFGVRGRAEHALIVVWGIFMISMSMAQIRFFYYLAIAVAVLNAYVIGLVVTWADLEEAKDGLSSIEGYQVLVLVTVLLVLVVPLMPGVAAGATVLTGDAGPQQATVQWEESLDWVSENTPEVGQLGNHDNWLDHYGTWPIPEGGDWEYEEGAYGIISWWDYGHLITVEGERIPHSNPFQSNARSSSSFLISQSEERASLILDTLPAGPDQEEKSIEELQAVKDGLTPQQQHEETRYVMIDDQMAGGKFHAITQWRGPDYSAYWEMGDHEIQGERLPEASDAYHDTALARLYLDDANEMEQYRLVHEADSFSVVGSTIHPDPMVGIQPHYSWPLGLPYGNQTQEMDMMLRQAAFQNQVVDQQLPGVPPVWNAEMHSSVKTFERVEGATLTASVDPDVADANATAIASVPIETNVDREFTYFQEVDVAADGTIEITVPYATNDELGVDDGYTDTDVVAQNDFTVFVSTDDGVDDWSGETAVPETAVIEGEEIEVDLEIIEDEEDEETPEEDDTTEDDDDDENTNEANDDE